MSRQYAVLNYAGSDGNVVIRIVEALSKVDAVAKRAEELSDPRDIFAISNAIPSNWGKGGCYLSRVTVTVPPPEPPPYKIDIGSYISHRNPVRMT